MTPRAAVAPARWCHAGMILVTAAAGMTGRHVLRGLREAGLPVRAFVRSRASVERVEAEGAAEVVVGDMLEPGDVGRAVRGVNGIVHIGPPMHPREIAMGRNVVDAAAEAGVKHFALMSVVHPQLEPLLNHQAKLEVERHLLGSRLVCTILQPMHYAQDVDVPAAVREGVHRQPYSLDRPLSFVDLVDVAEVAARVLAEPSRHAMATYELCGPDVLTGRQVAEVLSEVAGVAVRAEQLPLQDVVPQDAPDHTIDGFTRLFQHYDRYGILGNSNVLGWLLGRAPTGFREYARRALP